MTVGTLVNHWAQPECLGIVIGAERLKNNAGTIVQVHWSEPVEWEDDGMTVIHGHVCWTDPEELEIVSEVK